MSSKYRQNGMTLIEMMIVLVLLGIIIGAAMPDIKQLLATQQVRAGVHELSTDFALARIQAISRQRMVVVCPQSNGRCIHDSDWSRGWMVFVDTDGNDQPEHEADIIAIRQGGQDSLTIRSNHGRPRLRYLPSGASHGSNLTVNVCLAGRLRAQVVVNNAGRSRIDRRGEGNSCPM
ncbi:pilus assembly protein [Lysobacteraceae bacterium NML03-0222]|nr:pilus assembly protein [Xanthomonadaceae bacterium NML03-0222]